MDPSSSKTFTLQHALSLRAAEATLIEPYQLTLLREHLRHAARTPIYKNIFKQIGFSPDSVSAIRDLAGLPLTSREDIEQGQSIFDPGEGMTFSDIALTSGTTGEAVIVPYTKKDLDRLAFNETMGFYGAGIRQGDRVLLAVTLDRCFIAGLAYYSGLVRLGATAIRSGPGQPARQWNLIQKLRPKAIVGVPSFLLRLAIWGEENGINTRKCGIESLITIGEPIRSPDYSPTPLGKQLEDAWGAKIYSSYGATEFETAFCECSASCGGHVHPELMIVEIVDDEGNLLPDGQPGEVIVTPLGVEGFPLIRFRTGDIARLNGTPCQCGWQTKRLGPLEGRLAQRLKYKGTTLYPEMIFHVLQKYATLTVYVEVRKAADLSDELTVVVGTDDQQTTKQTVEEILQAHLRVRPKVVVQKQAEVLAVMGKDGGRKLKKFFDFRS
jgi:phenylacetate-CoA ligase